MACHIQEYDKDFEFKLSPNVHAMCRTCFNREDLEWYCYQTGDKKAERCCWCGNFTMAGIYCPISYDVVPCDSRHREENLL